MTTMNYVAFPPKMLQFRKCPDLNHVIAIGTMKPIG